MKILMLGWEFPPYISGGLGTACYGLTRGLDSAGVKVDFVLPVSLPQDAGDHVTFKTPANLPTKTNKGAGKTESSFRNVTMHVLPAFLQPYATPEGFAETVETLEQMRSSSGSAGEDLPVGVFPFPEGESSGMTPPKGEAVGYGGDLMEQVHRYASLAVGLAQDGDFDVIHAHDWMTYPAGLAVAALSGRPLVVHVHSTEFDRSGENVNQQVYDIERAGMHGADRVICVSYLTRGIALSRYGVNPEKVEVVYNAVDMPSGRTVGTKTIARDEKIVLFLGRVTMQKGPEYFLQAARKVLKKFKKVRFVIAGSGDLISQSVSLAAELRIGRHVAFTGFLRGDDVGRIFRMADLYVMPSVSEPFGIAPLEAISHNVPVIISKQSGVSEVLTHVLKVDFWDTDDMANKIVAVLRHPPLRRVLREQGQVELRKLSWRDSARKCKKIYKELIGEKKRKTGRRKK
ncbi:MAG: glycosyltransferase family 4 protein [Phycisphaerae bacterium]|nr:glycosyltransferase family 4 protein [Phycisphaerae bacterium]